MRTYLYSSLYSLLLVRHFSLFAVPLSSHSSPPSSQTLAYHFPWFLSISSTELSLKSLIKGQLSETLGILLKLTFLMAASTTSQVYIDVIEDVMVKVRDEFVNNGGPGEEVLKELQAVINHHLHLYSVFTCPRFTFNLYL